MNDPRLRRLNIWTPVLFAGVLSLGMMLGFKLRDSLRNKRDTVRLIERNDRLEEMIDFIREKYVDTVNVSNLYQDAVEGILSHLDPHTSYIAANELESVNDDLEGSFFGIGVEFDIIRDTIQVTAVVPKGPADRSGILIGDKLLAVNDSTVAGVGITSERIMKMLRGKQFSHATLRLLSLGEKNARKVVITRDAIPIYSVEASLLLDSTTGFIKINRFAASTYDEFVRALRSLQASGITGLIVDVRQNPGGFLEQAVAVADELIAGDKTLVITKSRTEETISKAKVPGLYETGNLAILVDEGAASAAEILAGAVQDNDRGLVIGRRTYGKGLVQEQFEMDDGSALRITVARYYTPSGRSLQRSYAAGKAAYAADHARRFETGELTGNTDSVQGLDTATYYTASHRRVRGGGGITPDIVVPYDSLTFNVPLLTLAYGEEAGMTAWEYFLQNQKKLKAYPSAAAFAADKTIGPELVKALSARLSEKDRAQLQRIRSQPAALSLLQNQLRAQIARYLFRSNGYYSITIPADPLVLRARAALNGSDYSRIIGR